MKQFLLLTILFITIASKTEEYKNFYTGTILPTPQEVNYSNEYLEIPLDQPSASVCILTSSPAKSTLKELVKLFGFFPKGLPVINNLADVSKYSVIIKITSLNFTKKPEAYSIKFLELKAKNIIEIACDDSRGLYWAVQSLKQLTFKEDKCLKIRKAKILDYPDFNIRIALGAPGKCFDNKFPVFYDYAKNLMKYKFNRYYIGGRRYMHDFAGISRSIPYNEASRIFWRKKSPEKSLKQLQTVIPWFKERGLALVPIINPAWDSNWKNPAISRKLHISSATQIDLLTKFLKQFTSIGCDEISLWLDDASLPLPVADKKFFGDEGKAHAYLVNKLYSALKSTSPAFKMTFCQAPYFTDCTEDARVKGWGDYKKYWQYMKKNVPGEIPFFWNGKHVCSYKVTNNEADYMSQLLDKKLLFLDFGWLGGHPDGGYHFDQIPVKKRLPDNFYTHVLGYARPFQAKPVNEIFFAQIADYMWNPKAFDPQKSLKNAISKILGPELLGTAEKWNKAVKVIDSFGMRVTPGAIKRISKLISAYNELHLLLKEFSAKTTRKDIVNDLREYTNSIDKYIKRLKQAKFPHIERRRKKLIKIIQKENKISSRDIILTSMDFTGGSRSGVYSYKCKPRYAIWAYAPEAVATMQVEFDLTDSLKDADLVICGQDDDREARCAIRIKINGHSIFKGKNPFNRFGWYNKTFSIPHKYLKKGKNEITIENIEQSDNMTGPPFIMISYAVLKLR
jgi:hypothetical protein